LAGWVGLGGSYSGSDLQSYKDAAGDARTAGEELAFILTLRSDDIDATLADPAKRMSLAGTVEAPALSPTPLHVSDGRFSLLSQDQQHLETTNMIYEMTLTADDGRRWQFRGVKYVHDDFGPDLWSDTTTLYVDLSQEDETGASKIVGRGVLRISLADFAKQVRTIEATNTSSRLEALHAQVRFGRFFMGSLFDSYGNIFARPTAFDPTAEPRKRRPLRAGPPQIHYFHTSDGEELCLTRYQGGDKGPVVLVHGLGVSSGIYTVDTIDTNLVEYLFAHGYDVWLLDFRASIEMPASSKQSNLDVMAAIDIPEGVAEVRRLSGAPTVQMVVHCVGSTVFYMAMLSGKLEGVRAAVTSQATPHIDGTTFVKLKSGLHLPSFLESLGIETLTAYTDTDANWIDRLYNRALTLYPTEFEERCHSASCHRITFMYSLLYEHDQLTVATHETLHELFGVASVT
ncbi:MAG: choline dehydrogenase, partial [Myxococcales bacterium]|nr:choline dehydrogenase [Myxococcales bacterium]